MVNAEKFWKFVKIDAAGKPRSSEILAAKAFFEQQFPPGNADLADSVIQNQLFQLLRTESAPMQVRQLAETCLRCYISHCIQQACIDLEVRFGHTKGSSFSDRFTRFDLFPIVLNDVDISKSLLFPSDSDSSSGSRSSSRSGASSPPPFRPLAYKILKTFKPEQSTLNTWARRLMERDPNLSDFLLECGIYFMSDWAILNATSIRGLCRQLSGHLSEAELQQLSQVLKSYHAIYKTDRLNQNLAGKKCLDPTSEQLQRMAEQLQADGMSISPSQVLRQLQNLAHFLRQIQERTAKQLDERQAEQQPAPDPNDEENDFFLTAYFREFLDCLDRAIEKVIGQRLEYHRRKQPPTDQIFLTALCLFHCQNQPMSKIAKEIGLQKQYQVTRLLNLKSFRADVRRHTIERMRDHDQLHTLVADYINLDRLASLDLQLEQALDQILAEAEAEALSPTRASQSLFTRRLCHYLHHRSSKS